MTYIHQLYRTGGKPTWDLRKVLQEHLQVVSSTHKYDEGNELL